MYNILYTFGVHLCTTFYIHLVHTCAQHFGVHVVVWSILCTTFGVPFVVWRIQFGVRGGVKYTIVYNI